MVACSYSGGSKYVVASGASPYVLPQTAEIAQRQDTLPALRLLLAQRRLYSAAKRWSNLRFVGLSLIAVAAPVLTALRPGIAVAVGAIAGGWIFLSRTVFLAFEQRYSSRGADVQEQFDLLVFAMPSIARRNPHLTPEEVSLIVGDDAQVSAAAAAERLRDWYPIDATLDAASAIAICQRANAAYSERLLNTNANIWLVVTGAWSALVLGVGLALGLSLANFVLGVALPLLPALLDVVDQWRLTRTAGAERRSMASGIEAAIRSQSSKAPLGADELLVWQDQIYSFRRKTPQVPDLVYSKARIRNERAMEAAARELTQAAKDAL